MNQSYNDTCQDLILMTNEVNDHQSLMAFCEFFKSSMVFGEF